MDIKKPLTIRHGVFKMVSSNWLLKRFSSNDSGNVSIMLGLSAIPLMFVASLSVDYGGWISQKANLAAAADAASLAGAIELAGLYIDRKDGEAIYLTTAVATKYALASGGEQETPNVEVATGDSMTVSVRLGAPGKQYFSKAVSETALKVGFKSVATAVRVANACVVALSKTASPGIEYNLSGDVIANGCSIWSNSETINSTNGNGSGRVEADTNCSVGTADVTSRLNIRPHARSNCIPVKDPFANWTPPEPPPGHCKNQAFQGTGTQTLSPGCYSNIRVNGQAKVYFEPGIYYIKRGTLTMVGGSELYGEGVTIIFTDRATADLGGTTVVRLSAPKSGPTEGMVFASGRDEPAGESILKGNSEFTVEGNIYLPTHNLRYSGGPQGSLPAEYTTIVASTLRFDGSSVNEFRHRGGGGSDEGARAVSHVHLIE